MFERRWIHIRHYFRQHMLEALLLLLFLLFLVVYFATNIFYTIPFGRVGVIWYRFAGTDLCKTLSPGFHIIPPWDKIYVYDDRLQQQSQTVELLSNNGLKVGIKVFYRYQLMRRNIPILHEYVGPNYADDLIGTEVLAAVRREVAKRQPEEIYSDRTSIETAIQEQIAYDLFTNFDPENLRVYPSPGASLPPDTDKAPATPDVVLPNTSPIPVTPNAARNTTTRQTFPTYISTPRPKPQPSATPAYFSTGCRGNELHTHFTWLTMQDVLISNVQLPPAIATAIEQTNEEQQKFARYFWRLKEEDGERQRRIIEAQGVADASRIASATLTDRYLTYRGIEATVDLATSPNAKVIVIGGGGGGRSGGLPLILGNNVDTPAAVSAAAAPAPAVDPLYRSPQQLLEERLAGR